MPQIFAVQFDIVWEDKPANHHRVLRMLETHDPVPSPGSLIVLPEMFDVGFTLNADHLSEEATEFASERWCAELARHFACYVQGASIRDAGSAAGGKATNNAVVFDPAGDLIARYEKIHPFSGGREPERYRGGRTLATFEWQGLTVCPFICYDLRFPEIWRLAAIEHGATLFTIGASWPAARHAHWSTLLEARAIENQAWVVGLNRTGRDPYLAYAGGSKVVDPQGKVLFEADDRPQIIHAVIEPELALAWRSTFAALRDARRAFLGSIERRTTVEPEAAVPAEAGGNAGA